MLPDTAFQTYFHHPKWPTEIIHGCMLDENGQIPSSSMFWMTIESTVRLGYAKYTSTVSSILLLLFETSVEQTHVKRNFVGGEVVYVCE